MLAIVLPAGGNMSGAPISIASDASIEENVLSIVLDDTTNPGFVTARITATGNAAPVSYWNFGGISFTGDADADGSIANLVTLQTPYQADLVGFGATGAGTPLSPTNWQVDAIFTASTAGVPNAFLDLFNADSLTAIAGTLGGNAVSTIAGEFQSPTDLTVADKTGAAIILVDSGIGLADNANGTIETYMLRLESTNGGIAIDADVTTASDLTIVGKAASLSLGDPAGGTLRTVSSENGDIGISASVGPISIRGVGVTSFTGGISVDTPSTLTIADGGNAGVISSFTAPATYSPVAAEVPDGLVRLAGGLSLTLPQTLPVTASRLELRTQSAALISLSQLSVGSLTAAVTGSLMVTNAVPLQISDLKAGTASVEIVAQNVTIQSPLGLRVVDGISAAGKLVLSTYVAGTTTNPPTTPIDFIVTGIGDNAVASDPFAGTLRDMIEYVNANGLVAASGGNPAATGQPIRILFDEFGSPVADGGEVTLAASLPALAKPLAIDGTLPDGSKVGINGNGSVNTGLAFGAGSSGSAVRDVALNRFAGSAIRIQSADNLISGLRLAENAIGIEISGAAALRNVVGVKTIGVDTGNYIVGNSVAGVLVRGRANFVGIYGNTIGDEDSGNVDGIQVIDSIGTMIGAAQADLRNTVSNNTSNGIRLTNVNAVSVPYGTQVVNNVIRDNVAAGVLIDGGRANLVGGTGLNAGNTISGNSVGVHMQSNGTARTQANQVVNNTIADSSIGGVLIDQGYANLVQGNTVTDNSKWGIRLFRAPQASGMGPNRVYQNTVSGSGDEALNGGIVVENSIGQVIGGSGTLANRVISNGGSGIVIVGGTGSNAARSNLVEGNFVGTDATGSDRGNEFDGIRLQGSVGNVVRGNTVSYQAEVANNAAGIAVYDSIAGNASLGNAIVLNTVASNNFGILVSGGAHTAIGGRVAGLGNSVFGNVSDGILVNRSAATGNATATMIRGNRVGIGTGTQQVGNGGYGINLVSTVGTTVDQGNLVAYNSAGGIKMEGGRNAAIGSLMTGLGNVIRDNAGDGIRLVAPAAPGRTEAVLIAGNTVRGNDGNGMAVVGTRVSGITIGRGVSVNRPDASTNTIVGNGLAGVLVDGAGAVSIIGNAITGNLGEKQIELLNDANAGVVLPALTAATPRVVGQASPQYDVRGTVSRTGTGTAAQTAIVDIYGTNTATNEQFFLGRVTVTIRAGAASAIFRVIVGRAGRRFDQVVATATLGSGTSELSNAIGV